MDTLYLILYILAALCFLVASFSTYAARTRGDAGDVVATSMNRLNWVALGLLFWVLVPLIQHIDTQM